MLVKELIEELENYDPDTEVEVIVDFGKEEISSVSGSDEEGVSIELEGV